MGVIVVEGILFIALLAALAVLVWVGLVQHTPFGLRLRQARNRRRIDRNAELRCPVHGAHSEQELIRLTSGERVCPVCYEEAVQGKIE